MRKPIRQDEHYPPMHVTGCPERHVHSRPECCTPACWCHIEPIHVVAHSTAGPLQHLPHRLCRETGWHERRSCPAFIGKDGGLEPRHTVWPHSDGKPYTLSEIETRHPPREAA